MAPAMDPDYHRGLPPLAIIGMSMRFPQEATTADAFWNMLITKRCASTDFPADRLNISAFYHPDPARLESMSMRGGHFITGDLGAFDAPFFSIGAAEAEAMDPAQRFTLETAYRAIENAGISVESIAGTKTCVYTGCFFSDYSTFLPKDPLAPPKYNVAGTAVNMIANRLSWFFDLVGPSANVDTACSSSLMAVDLVCQSIWAGESVMGLACGSNIVFSPENMASLDNLGFLSKDSRCFSFDHRANGYARGEGFGVLVIKPLETALRDGDSIRAVIRSSSSNQDGKTPGLTQPSKQAQERLIRDTYKKAGLDMHSTRYFEAHGTGTSIGDPLEAGAIGVAFRSHRSAAEPLYMGSVKSNIGHLEGASGVAGVIKTVLALERGVIPPNSNFERLNPKIDSEFLRIKIPTIPIPWPTNGLRRASVQSFGFGGSNSHLVLDDAYNYLLLHGLKGHHSTVNKPPPTNSRSSSVGNGHYQINRSEHGRTNGTKELHTNGISRLDRLGKDHLQRCNDNGENATHTGSNGVVHANGLISISHCDGTRRQLYGSDSQVLVWSAGDDNGISRLTQTWQDHFSSREASYKLGEDMRNLAHTLASRRTHLPWRTFAVAKSGVKIDKVFAQLSAPFRAGSSNVVYVFTGQGAQWYAMGRELLGRYAVFRDSVLDASTHLRSLGCLWNPLDELLCEETQTNINKTEYSQALCTIVQVGLVDLLESFGVRPVAVVGHSSGEIAAAYCAKALTRHSAWEVAYYRGALAAQLEEFGTFKGGMLSVGLSRSDTLPYLERVSSELCEERLQVACVNSPKNLTISGAITHLDLLQALLENDRIFARRLKVTIAYHSFQMQEIAEPYLSCIADITGQETRKNAPIMVSSVTGTWVSAETLSKPGYWVRNMVQPVLFCEALSLLCSKPRANKIKKKLDGSHRHLMSVTQLIEIGPHSALQGPSREILQTIGSEQDITYMSLLKRNTSAVDSLLDAAGRLYCFGYPIDLACVNSTPQTDGPSVPLKTLTNLPEYSFNHGQSYWCESRLSKDFRFRRFGRLELLGTPSADWNPLQAKWRSIIRVSELPWVIDHKINGVILYPAVGMITMVVEAAKQLANSDLEITGFLIKNATFHSALVVPDAPEGIEVNIDLRPQKDAHEKRPEWFEFRICTLDSDIWQENCTGSIQIQYIAKFSDIDRGQEVRLWGENHRRAYKDYIRNCKTSVNPTSLYDQISNCGYGYGPAFQSIKTLAYNGADKIVSEVKTFPWSKVEGPSVAQPHIIHPATFDGILQTVFAAYTKGGTRIMPTIVPSHINRLWLSSRGLSYPEAESIKAYANTEWTGLRDSQSNINALDARGEQVLVELQGVKTTLVAASDATEHAGKVDTGKCHTIDWKPDLDLLSSEALQSFCDETFQSEPEPVDYYTEVDFILLVSIMRTLKDIDDGVRATLNSNHHTKMYLEWMEHQIEILRDGLSPFSSIEWRSRMEDSDYVAQLTKRLASKNKQGLFFTTVATNLEKLLTREMDPLNVLFQGDLVKDHYYEVWDAVPCLKRLGNYLDAYLHKNPGAKFLEVGAGTGAMTHQIMKTLAIHSNGEQRIPRYGQFDYTDISPFFFGAAQETYQGHGTKMRFKIFNVEREPESQGFECGSYDCVVAAAVLHATAELTTTLKHCRKLLKSLVSRYYDHEEWKLLTRSRGGKLIMLEITRPDVFRTALVFGLLEGWWLSSEDYRRWSPCVDEHKWDELLVQTGFSGSEIVLHDYDHHVCHEYSVIISTATQKQPAPTTGAELVLIHSTGQEQISRELQTNFHSAGGFSVKMTTVEKALGILQPSTLAIFLLELDQTIWYDMDSALFEKIRKLLTTVSHVLWVSRGGGLIAPAPHFRLVDGLFRVLNSEISGTVFASLSLESERCLNSHQLGHIVKLSHSLLRSQDLDTEFIEHNGLLHINRLVESTKLNTLIHTRQLPYQKRRERFGGGGPLRLTVGSPGLLNTLQFFEDKERDLPLHPDEMEIQVQNIGLNFRDVLIALGQLSELRIGVECSGIVSRVGEACQVEGFELGTRVAACVSDSYKSFVRVSHRAAAKIPDSISFQVAAAIPVNYVTAWHSLHHLARVQPGETVLIHSGAGGTGQAAIQLAHHLGATIFTTVGTEEKRDFITRRYGIPGDHIFSSRDTLFARSIRRLTSDRGVDVVLNSLSGEGLAASWECIAPYGRFIEIGKKDILSHNYLEMFPFAKNVMFAAVDVAAMSFERPQMVRRALEAVFPLIENGTLTPSEPLMVYGVSEMEKAFRNIQSGKSTGKAVVELRADDYVETVLETKPIFSFDSNATFVIAGGTGGLGRSVSRWFVERGARNLILLSRTGANSSEAQDLVSALRDQGVNIQTPACDISDLSVLMATLGELLLTMPPVKGCIQASMTLKDATFESMTFEAWEAATLPKVQGSWNLHLALPKGIDFFVLFSSMAGIFGSRGQSNYAAGNTFQDALARYRVGIGERGSALDLGVFLSAGILSENKELRDKFKANSFFDPVTETELFTILEDQCDPAGKRHDSQTVVGVGIAPHLHERGANVDMDLAYWLKKPSFRQVLTSMSKTKDQTSISRGGEVNFPTLFATAPSLANAGKAVTQALLKKLAKTLSLAPDEIDISKPLHSYGVDSLVAVELRNWFLKEPNADVAIFDILGGATISAVGMMIASKSKYRNSEWKD